VQKGTTVVNVEITVLDCGAQGVLPVGHPLIVDVIVEYIRPLQSPHVCCDEAVETVEIFEVDLLGDPEEWPPDHVDVAVDFTLVNDGVVLVVKPVVECHLVVVLAEPDVEADVEAVVECDLVVVVVPAVEPVVECHVVVVLTEFVVEADVECGLVVVVVPVAVVEAVVEAVVDCGTVVVAITVAVVEAVVDAIVE
jgi:hypothetical protein